MFSIKVDKDIVLRIKEIAINKLLPHEKVLLDKKDILKNTLKYKNIDIIISTIIICSETNLIIDGHHRYTALKELGYKKLITTPHIMSDLYQNTPSIIHAGLEILKKELIKQEIDIDISAAAEYYVDYDFEQKIGKEELKAKIERNFWQPEYRQYKRISL